MTTNKPDSKSSDRPAAIRITDLAQPDFSTEQQAAVDIATAMAVEQLAGTRFSLDALMTTASDQAGLDDFGADEFKEPLSVLCDSIEKQGRLSPMGRLGVWSQLSTFLVNRLRLEDLYRRHPEISQQQITAPIIIAGMPRSGTTHLHNLIASDSALRSLPWWEALEPVAPLHETAGQADPASSDLASSNSAKDPTSSDSASDPAGRIQRAQEGINQRNFFLPHFDRMHEMTWDHVHEEIHLLGMSGSTMLFDTMGVFPAWREYYKATDQTPHYEYLKRILKALQFLRGPDRWILKSPQHMEQFSPLMNVFPDATFAVTHRDPVSITASFCTMVCYTSRLTADLPMDTYQIGQWWAQLIEDMLTSCTNDRHLLPAEQSLDVLFHEFMANDIATVERIYSLAGQKFDAGVAQTMRQYMETHPRGRHGRVEYDLADFGIDPAERRAALEHYVERFGIQLES